MDYYNGVVKVKDGLFMGNFETGEDFDFITDNKITRIINCAGYELSNLFESSGIKYLTYNFLDNSVQVIFDEADEIITEIASFIDSSLNKGESCLIWSVNGCSRSACITISYLMIKYSWSLYKSLDYLSSKFQSLSLSPNFLHQLFNLQGRLLNNHNKFLTVNWESVSNEDKEIEDLVLQNTYLNSKTPKVLLPPRPLRNSSNLKWNEKLLIEKENKQEGPILVKSCLKGKSENSFVYTPSRGSSTEISFRSDSESRKENLRSSGKGEFNRPPRGKADFNGRNGGRHLGGTERLSSTECLHDVQGGGDGKNRGDENLARTINGQATFKLVKPNLSRSVRTPSPIVFTDLTIKQNRLRRPWR